MTDRQDFKTYCQNLVYLYDNKKTYLLVSNTMNSILNIIFVD